MRSAALTEPFISARRACNPGTRIMNVKTKRVILPLVALAVLAGLIILSIWGRPIMFRLQRPTTGEPQRPTEVTLQGKAQEPEIQTLTAPAAGMIAALGATEGAPVTHDQLILQIDNSDLRKQHAAAMVKLARLERQVLGYKQLPVAPKVEAAQARVDEARVVREHLAAQLGDYETQHPGVASAIDTLNEAKRRQEATEKVYNAIRPQAEKAQRVAATGKPSADYSAIQQRFKESLANFQSAEQNLRLAQDEHQRLHAEVLELGRLRESAARAIRCEEQANADMKRLQVDPTAKALVAAEAALAAARKQAEQTEQALTTCAIKAPVDGLLTELRVRPGMTIRAGQKLATVRATGGVRLVFEAAAADSQRLRVGQQAVVIATAEGKSFKATISQLVPLGELSKVYLEPLGKVVLPAPGTALSASFRG